MQTTLGPLDRIVVNTRSPDRNIHVTFRGRHGIELRFAHGAYFRYDDASLAAQLGPLATTTWAEYRRAYFAALSEELGRAVRPEDRSDSSRLNEYRQELAQLKLSGDSPGGWVQASSVGLVRWRFQLRPGARRGLSTEEFIAEVHGAVRAVFADYDSKAREAQARLARQQV